MEFTYIHNALNQRQQVGEIFCDLSKVFVLTTKFLLIKYTTMEYVV
jgi:hypothetical protein